MLFWDTGYIKFWTQMLQKPYCASINEKCVILYSVNITWLPILIEVFTWYYMLLSMCYNYNYTLISAYAHYALNIWTHTQDSDGSDTLTKRLRSSTSSLSREKCWVSEESEKADCNGECRAKETSGDCECEVFPGCTGEIIIPRALRCMSQISVSISHVTPNN